MGLITSDKFTTETVSFIVEDGTNVPDTQATAIIMLIPKQGYILDYTGFIYNGVSGGGSYITSGVFTQDGLNVKLTITFSNFIMPASNLDIPLCINISSTEQLITISGSYAIETSNTLPLTLNGTYQASGLYGSNTEVIRKVFRAISGSYFEVEPVVYPNVDNLVDYTITTDTVYDGNNLIEKSFVITYTFPDHSVSGDLFSFVANALAVVDTTPYIRSWSINRDSIPSYGQLRKLAIYGDPGAIFSVTAVGNTVGDILTLPITSVVMPSDGKHFYQIDFPSTVVYQDYTLQITGDLAIDFIDTIIILNQLVDLIVDFALTSTDPTLTGVTSAPTSITRVPNTIYSSPNLYNITLTAAFSTSVSIIDTIDVTSFTNLDPTLNGGTTIDVSNIVVSVVGSNTISVSFAAAISVTGGLDVHSIIDLDTYISTNTLPVADNKTLTTDEDVAIIGSLLSGSDVDNDPLTYYLGTTSPVNGVISNFNSATGTFDYTPNSLYFGVDDFTYYVNDGYGNSAEATVHIDIIAVISPPMFTNEPPLYTGIVGGTYTWNMTYTDIDTLIPDLILEYIDAAGNVSNTLPGDFVLTKVNGVEGAGSNLTGTVTPGTTTFRIRISDPEGSADERQFSVSAAYDILENMEFVVAYTNNNALANYTASSPKTKSPIAVSGAHPNNVNGHTCNDAGFVLLAETINLQGVPQTFKIGNANLANRPDFGGSPTYRLLNDNEGSRPDPSISSRVEAAIGDSYVASSLIDIAGGTIEDVFNVPTSPYAAGDLQTYYAQAGGDGTRDRHDYLVIDPATLALMASSTSTGEFVLKLAPDSWKVTTANATVYQCWTHGEAGWLRVFKENALKTNQEEVTDANGKGFLLSSASRVTINIFTGTVTVA